MFYSYINFCKSISFYKLYIKIAKLYSLWCNKSSFQFPPAVYCLRRLTILFTKENLIISVTSSLSLLLIEALSSPSLIIIRKSQKGAYNVFCKQKMCNTMLFIQYQDLDRLFKQGTYVKGYVITTERSTSDSNPAPDN